MSDRDLKPCPFCGRKVTFGYDANLEPYGIICPCCHAETIFYRIKVKKGEKFEVAMKQMAEAWNRRQSDAP